MARKTIKAMTRDTVAESKPNPMTSVPVPHDPTKPYIGNSLFSSVVFVKEADGSFVYYRAKKDVPANTPISNKEYWQAMSTAQQVNIHEAFISMLMADQAFVNSLKTKILTAENIAALNITTGNLTVTDGAKVGYFEIASGDMYSDKGSIVVEDDFTLARVGGRASDPALIGRKPLGGTALELAAGKYSATQSDLAISAIGGADWNIAKGHKWCMPGLLSVLEYKMYGNLSSTCVRVWGDGLTRFGMRSDVNNHLIAVEDLNMGTRPYFVNAIAVGASADGNRWGLTPQIEWLDGNGFGISFWDSSANKRWPGKAWFFIYGTPQLSPV